MPLQSLQLRNLERVKGIEPSYAAWEAAVLPLNYTRKSNGLLLPAHNIVGVFVQRFLVSVLTKFAVTAESEGDDAVPGRFVLLDVGVVLVHFDLVVVVGVHYHVVLRAPWIEERAAVGA